MKFYSSTGRSNDGNFNHIEDLFLNNRIYFPSPKEFNDPFDCQVDLSLTGTEKEWRKYFHDRMVPRTSPGLSRAQRRQMVQRFIKSKAYTKIDPSTCRRIIEQYGIFCLSAVRDDILMWSHYSEKHTGLVLEFRAGPDDSFFRRSEPVTYQEQYPTLRPVDPDEERARASALTKSSHWGYEQEYRIIECQGPGTYTFPEHLLAGVVFGCQMLEERKAQIREWVARRTSKPILYQARKKDQEFGLSIEVAP